MSFFFSFSRSGLGELAWLSYFALISSIPCRLIFSMNRSKKPGGVVAVRESDLRAWSVYPEFPGLLAMNKMLCAVQEANGANVNAGAQLVSWALANGVKRDQITASAGTWCYSAPAERQIWGQTMADRCLDGAAREKAIALGISTVENLKEMSEAWERWVDAEDGWFGCMHGEALIKL